MMPTGKEEMTAATTTSAGTVVLKVASTHTHVKKKQSYDSFTVFNATLSGETSNTDVNALRVRQMKNFHLALMLSQVRKIMCGVQ